VGLDRRLLFNLDGPLLFGVLCLCGIGVAAISSATHTGSQPDIYLKQLTMVGLGVACLLIALVPDYRTLVDRSPLLLLAMIGVLAFVLVFAPRIAGTRRWLVVGPLQLQPSELAKLVAVLLMSKLFAESRKESLGLLDLAAPGGAVGILFLLIAAEPDLGSAFCLVPPFLTVALLAGLRPRALLALCVAALVVGGLGWQFALKDYQKTRVLSFLDPDRDPKGAGYQKIQSQIAVGSGGLLGKGFRQGSQSQLGYLPARHTDFIFSVIAEESGFLGVSVVLGLYLLVLWRCLEAARLARDRAGAYLVAGITAILAFQVVYNVAMVAGLVPVKGLPLPFISYGGSSVLASLVGVGLIMNTRMRRFVN
jgi:rod shape determining protein RodA